jgi:hypothetical protein
VRPCAGVVLKRYYNAASLAKARAGWACEPPLVTASGKRRLMGSTAAPPQLYRPCTTLSASKTGTPSSLNICATVLFPMPGHRTGRGEHGVPGQRCNRGLHEVAQVRQVESTVRKPACMHTNGAGEP